MDALPIPEVPAYCHCHGDLPTDSRHFQLMGHWQLHLYRGHGRLAVGSAVFELAPGWMSLIPPAHTSVYDSAGPFPYHAVHFRWPSSVLRAAVCWHIGGRADEVRAVFDTVIRLLPVDPQRARLHLWDLLLVSDPPAVGRRLSPVVERCLSWLGSSLAAEVTIAALARRSGLSAVHLNRLFKRETGLTVAGNRTRLRRERADHQLRYTNLPFASIAAEIGCADAQHFNKWVRANLGASPSAIRQG